jgi:hypothetical protein
MKTLGILQFHVPGEPVRVVDVHYTGEHPKLSDAKDPELVRRARKIVATAGNGQAWVVKNADGQTGPIGSSR